MMIAKRVVFRGRVQGVGFRYVVKQSARSFDVSGWVRNADDGTVELEVTGEAGEVADFIREIAEESAVAHHIRSHLVQSIPPFAADGFRILRS
jgi:acylphosphatase